MSVATTMREMLQKEKPEGTLHDVARIVRAQRKRASRAKKYGQARSLRYAEEQVNAELAMIRARRAALPRLHPCREWIDAFDGGGAR